MTATAIKDADLGGTISYNGFTFGEAGSTPPTYRLRGTPVYDESGRAVTHVAYLLEVTAIVHADDEPTVGGRMQQLRRQLSRPGRKLEILDVGLGDTTVADGATHPDVLWGAKPRVVSLEPIGGTLAWQLQWHCEFQVSEAASGAGRSQNWLAFNFQSRYAIDGDGFTSRTIQGYLQIVQTRRDGGDPTVRITADARRDRLRIVVPDGFRRHRSEWTESTDKSRLDFVVEDRQLRDDPYPPGIVAADVDYRIENRGPGFTNLTASISGFLETAPGVPKSAAAARLLAIAQDKLERLQAGLGGKRGGLVVPSRIALVHKLFSRRTSCEIDLVVVGGLVELLTDGGMWSPVPGSDYRRWRRSVEPCWDNRGSSGLRSRADDAAIIDLVDNPVDRATIRGDGKPTRRPETPAALPRLFPTATVSVSWLEYRASVRLVQKQNISIHTFASGDESGCSSKRVRETHGVPHRQAILEGEALRLGFLPTTPVLASIGGRPVVENQRSEELEQSGDYGGISAYRLRWSITYDLDGSPGRFDAPENPTISGSGRSSANR